MEILPQIKILLFHNVNRFIIPMSLDSINFQFRFRIDGEFIPVAVNGI